MISFPLKRLTSRSSILTGQVSTVNYPLFPNHTLISHEMDRTHTSSTEIRETHHEDSTKAVVTQSDTLQLQPSQQSKTAQQNAVSTFDTPKYVQQRC